MKLSEGKCRHLLSVYIIFIILFGAFQELKVFCSHFFITTYWHIFSFSFNREKKKVGLSFGTQQRLKIETMGRNQGF